jgi:hypothetical protein
MKGRVRVHIDGEVLSIILGIGYATQVFIYPYLIPAESIFSRIVYLILIFAPSVIIPLLIIFRARENNRELHPTSWVASCFIDSACVTAAHPLGRGWVSTGLDSARSMSIPLRSIFPGAFTSLSRTSPQRVQM